MQSQFQRFLESHNLLKSCDGKPILLAVSGGVDSMVMLHLFLKNNIPLRVAHCNFTLRQEARADEQLVTDFCQNNNIPFFCKRFETKKYAEQKKCSVQMAARALRYQWFEELLIKENACKIATAHNLNDSIETLLMNILHARGWEGMNGIKVSEGNRIRPVLFASRDEIVQYAVENKIQWREDESNASLEYERNYVRHKIIPELKHLNPSLEKTFSDFQYKINSASWFLRYGIEQWKEKFTTQKGDDLYIHKNSLDTPALWILLQPFGFHISQVQQLAAMRGAQAGKFFQSATHIAAIDREYLIVKKNSRQRLPAMEVNEGSTTRGRTELKLTQVERRTEKNAIYFDFDKLKFPLLWRAWREGDFFYPLGMEHRKKISDFLIDNKIPLTGKEDISVVESDGNIIWVVGMRIDNRFKVLPETKRVLEVELKLS